MYVPSLSVSAQRENKRFIHEIGKEGNVNIFFFMKTVKIAFIVMMFPLIDARMFIIDARIKKGCPGGGGYPISGKIQTYFIHIVKLPEISL